jgi:hypothetical protein
LNYLELLIFDITEDVALVSPRQSPDSIPTLLEHFKHQEGKCGHFCIGTSGVNLEEERGNAMERESYAGELQ